MNRFFNTLAAFAIFTIAPASWALTINNAPATDVGIEDIFVYASTKNELPNSNPTSEENWIESILGVDVDYAKYGSNVPITATNEDSTIFAWELADAESDYFLVKNAAFWALFQNVGNLAYAVVDADSGYLPSKMNFGNSTISHYGVVNGRNPGCELPSCDPNPPNETPVPGPAPLLLIPLALFLMRSRLKVAA